LKEGRLLAQINTSSRTNESYCSKTQKISVVKLQEQQADVLYRKHVLSLGSVVIAFSHTSSERQGEKEKQQVSFSF
jgi:hypothetical protein